MRAATIIGCAAALLTVTGMATAAPLQKGTSIFAIQLTEGAGDFVFPEGGFGTINSFVQTEMGVQAQFWHFMTNEYAFNASAGIGFFKESDSPGDNATPLDEVFKRTTSSWQVRIGGDRVAHLNDRFHLFVGPGIQIWSGKAKFEFGASASESESAMRYALSGRMGAHLKLGESFGMIAQLGHYWAYASAEEAGATAKWLPTGHDGAAGFAFSF